MPITMLILQMAVFAERSGYAMLAISWYSGLHKTVTFLNCVAGSIKNCIINMSFSNPIFFNCFDKAVFHVLLCHIQLT